MESMNCIVETPKGLGVKYNYDHKLGRIELGKVLPAGLVFPFDFGYILGTIGQDGDPLDVIIISEVPSFPGCAIKCRIIGGMQAIQRERDDQEMRNDRYLAIPEVSVLYKNIKGMHQLPDQILQELENFFINYNQQAGKKFKPIQWIKTDQALKNIETAQADAEPTKLIQLFVPLYNSDGELFPQQYYKSIEKKLIKEFGGMISYVQSPALGLWKEEKENIIKDEMVVYEVMASKIDKLFWSNYKASVQKQFGQKEIVLRQIEIGLL